MSKKAFTLLEVLISFVIMSLIYLAIADFSSNSFETSYNHLQQINQANQYRATQEIIQNEILKSYYIFPANKSITLNVSGSGNVIINTNTSIATLKPTSTSISSTSNYGFTAFYLANDTTSGLNDLYEFTSTTQYTWTQNTVPNITSVSGTSSLITTNIIPSSSTSSSTSCSSTSTTSILCYSVNYNNSIYDNTALLGTQSGMVQTNTNALINGIDWVFVVQQNTVLNKTPDYTVEVKEGSQNVPRFFI